MAIGSDRLCVVVLTAGPDRPQVQAVHLQPLNVALFQAAPSVAAEDALAQALLATSAEFRGLYAPVHVALPDTVLRSTVFELEEWPRKPELRQALTRWRLARQWQRSEESLECRSDYLGQDGGAHLLLAQAVDAAWMACVRQALARAGIVPWSLNGGSVYRFNHFHDVMTDAAGALLTLDPDSWSVLLWDDVGRLRQVLTRLRDGQAGADEMAAIADEAERAILAYVQADGRRRVDRLHLCGASNDISLLGRVFEARLREPALALQLDSSVHNAGSPALRDGLATLALTAALNS